MPIVHFINSKAQSTGGMKGLLRYVSKEEKTKFEDKRYVTGINCMPQTAYEEFNATKNLYHKNGGRLYYHLVQSFPSGYDIDPSLAHKIAVEFAEKAFGKYECVVATHIDREHIHSHIVFNSVSFDDGRKYHSDKNTVQELMDLSDEICKSYGVDTLAKHKQKQNNDVMSDREYRSAYKGESWKFQLMNAITEVMKLAKNKKQFVFLMRQYGYSVRWEDNRKYITYTCPNGMKCRDKRLHEDRYTKEMIEYEFKIRHSFLNGEEQGGPEYSERDHADGDSAGSELVGGDRAAVEVMRGAERIVTATIGADDKISNEALLGKPKDTVRPSGGRVQRDTGANKSSDDITHKSDRRIEATGWETERGILLTAERARRIQTQDKLENVRNDSPLPIGTADIISGIAALAEIVDDDEYEDYDDYHTIDSKEMERIIRKKEELGMKM